MVAGAVAIAGVFVLRDDARYVYDRLTDQGLPLVILSAACGLGALVLIARGARRGARELAVGAVVAVIWGWGVAQFPYLLPERLTISEGAAPDATLTAVLIVFGAAVVLVLPALAFLYTLTQRSMLEGEYERPRLAAGGRCTRASSARSSRQSATGIAGVREQSKARSTTSRRSESSRPPGSFAAGSPSRSACPSTPRGASTTRSLPTTA